MNFFLWREDSLILNLILLPAISSLLSFIIIRPRFLREIILVSIAFIFFASVYALINLNIETSSCLHLVNLSKNLSITFAIEPIGVTFLLLISILWLFSTIYSLGYLSLDSDQDQSRFFGFLSLSILFTVMVAIAGNLFTLFASYELLSLGTYPLIIYYGTKESYQAGKKYLIYLFASSTFLFFPAVVLLQSLNNQLIFNQMQLFISLPDKSTAMIIIFCLIFGIAKTAVFPLHNWLPEAMAAPTPVSALLHAVTVVKAGVFTLIKIFVFVFGIETLNEFMNKVLLNANLFTYIAIFSTIYSSLKANKQDNIKRMLAYSTVSQLSICLLTISIFSKTAIIACILHIFSHAFAKISLFFIAGIIYTKYGKSNISECSGMYQYNKFLSIIFVLCGLSLIGLPPFFGFWSKYYIILAAWEENNLPVIVTILFSTILTTRYIFAIIYRLFWSNEKVESNLKKLSYKSNFYLYYSLVFTASICFIGLIFVPVIIEFLDKNINW